MSVLSNESRQKKALGVIAKATDPRVIQDAIFSIHFLVLNFDLARELYTTHKIKSIEDGKPSDMENIEIEMMKKRIDEGFIIHEGTHLESLALLNKARFSAFLGERDVAEAFFQQAMVKVTGEHVEIIGKYYSAFLDKPEDEEHAENSKEL